MSPHPAKTQAVWVWLALKAVTAGARRLLLTLDHQICSDCSPSYTVAVRTVSSAEGRVVIQSNCQTQEEACKTLKEWLTIASLPAYANYTKFFRVCTEGSFQGLGSLSRSFSFENSNRYE